MMFDAAFVYEMFVQRLPKTYVEFASHWTSLFPATYDTKSLAASAGEFNKTALSHLFYRCQKDKRISNNLMFDYDSAKSPKFGHYL